MSAKLIVGAPVKDRAWILPAWHAGIRASGDYPIVCLLSRSEDDSEAVLSDLGVEVVPDPEVGRPVNAIDDHLWDGPAYGYMARLRNQLLDLMIERDAEYFLSLDSDIVLPPNAINDLLMVMKSTGADVIAPAVAMCFDPLEWNTMNWGYEGAAWRDFVPMRTGPVDVVMGAMLLNRSAIESCRWEATVQGEDIGFCRQAHRLGLSRWWVPALGTTHMMFKEAA